MLCLEPEVRWSRARRQDAAADGLPNFPGLSRTISRTGTCLVSK